MYIDIFNFVIEDLIFFFIEKGFLKKKMVLVFVFVINFIVYWEYKVLLFGFMVNFNYRNKWFYYMYVRYKKN